MTLKDWLFGTPHRLTREESARGYVMTMRDPVTGRFTSQAKLQAATKRRLRQRARIREEELEEETPHERVQRIREEAALINDSSGPGEAEDEEDYKKSMRGDEDP